MHDTTRVPGLPGGVGGVPSTLLAQDGSVATVTGEVAVRDLGMVLMHEHVMVDFIGADKVSRSRYDADEVVRVALPHLKEAHELGCQTLVECTPAFLGRNAALLQRLSQESGLRIIANTGYYGAAGTSTCRRTRSRNRRANSRSAGSTSSDGASTAPTSCRAS